MDRNDYKGKCFACSHLRAVKGVIIYCKCNIEKEEFKAGEIFTNTCDDYENYEMEDKENED